jgi:hypothetical protein
MICLGYLDTVLSEVALYLLFDFVVSVVLPSSFVYA